jgi:hypothetical protein
MDKAIPVTAQVPVAFIRSAVITADIPVLLVFAFLFGSLLSFTAAGVAAAGAGIVLALALPTPFVRLAEVLPVFPVGARVLTGLSVIALGALLFSATILAWRFVLAAWRGFAAWHRATWQGTWTRLADLSVTWPTASTAWWWVRATGIVFAALFAASFTLMMALARGPFWHSWGWFV